MRHYEIRFSPGPESFHPFTRALEGEEDVRQVAIHQMRLVSDDLGLMLYELAGDPDRIEELMAALLGDLGYQLNRIEGRIFVYSLLVPNDTVRELLRIIRDFEVFLDPPIRFTRSGDIVVRYVGTEESVHRAMSIVPEDVTATLQKKREYQPGGETFAARLTARQREIFDAAVELGYYSAPREATQEDIGEAVGLASGTVGEHLRKIESRLVAFVVSEPVESPAHA